MIVLAIFTTFCAAIWTGFVLFANGMRSSSGEFRGLSSIAFAWIADAVMWLAVAFN